MFQSLIPQPDVSYLPWVSFELAQAQQANLSRLEDPESYVAHKPRDLSDFVYELDGLELV